MRAVPTVVILLTCAAAAAAQGTVSREFTEAEAVQRIKELTPKPSAFVFVPQPGWSANLVRGAVVRKAVPSDAQAAARMAIDGNGYSEWVAPLGAVVPELTLDLGRPETFDRLVVFTRYTDAKGTGGGNNALRAVAMSTAPALSGPFTRERLYAVEGPSAMCLKTVGGGQICFFIDRTEPAVLGIPPQTARFVRLRLLEAHWGEYAAPEWKTSVVLSEVMLYRTPAASVR